MMTLIPSLEKNIDIRNIRTDFPILSREVYPGVPLIYLDSSATSQKPKKVLDAMDNFNRRSNANIHRGIHTLAEEATSLYEKAREKVAEFIGADSKQQIIFTSNTTESINLVAYSWGRENLNKGDVIVLTELEHHSNLVPWQILAAERDLQLEFIKISPEGLLDLNQYTNLLQLNPRLVAFAQMSNVLGTISPAKKIIDLAHQAGAFTLVDGAQSVPHFPVDVKELKPDFLAFSAHKMCGPTGIGVLYGDIDILDSMPPFFGGGDMIKRVQLRSFESNELPYKFEAGTPAITEAIGFGAAVDYLSEIGMDSVANHESALIEYALQRLEEIPGIDVLGPSAEHRGGVASFTLNDIHPHDLSQVLDREGVAIRAGHHCAMPLHEKYQIPASARASFYLYNNTAEIDKMIAAIYKAKSIFS